MPEAQDIKHAGPVLKHKQSKTNILPRLSSRICVAGPSGVGKRCACNATAEESSILSGVL